jgi:hypothetical protein
MSIAVVGGGPAGLMAAEIAARGGARVTVYDGMPTFGRKFLMAGRGGLNLTHSEMLPQFLERYGTAAPHLHAAIEAFSPERVRQWCEALGQPTFTGTSGRVFPKAMKASPLLRAWLRELDHLGVAFRPRHRFTGRDATGDLSFDTPQGAIAVSADAVVLALGGASWPKLGSDGEWAGSMSAAGVSVSRLRAANCGFLIAWSEKFRNENAGAPLKRIALSFGGATVRGECVVTAKGLEGGAIYALSAPLRDGIERDGEAPLHVDLRPDVSEAALTEMLAASRGKQSLSTFLRKRTGLPPVAVALLHEAAIAQETLLAGYSPVALAALIKQVPLRLTGIASIEKAISTAGGIAFDALDPHYMLRRMPGVFAAGEMLDWEAPTGGYLLQACLATGAAAGRGALCWLAGKQ